MDDNEDIPRLEDNQEEFINSKLIGNADVYFNDRTSKKRMAIRDQLVPAFLYRTSSEDTANLSTYTPKECHKKTNQNPDLKLHRENAFQSMLPFALRGDLNRERVCRTFIAQMTRDPSCYIHLFSTLRAACMKARQRYNKASPPQQRVYIAKINNKGLVPATVKGRMHTEVRIHTRVKNGLDEVEKSDHSFNVEVSIWIRLDEDLGDLAKISLEDLEKLDPEVLLFINELRESSILHGPKSRKYLQRSAIYAESHDHEWLFAGAIHRRHIEDIMPYDGQTLHQVNPQRPIKSIKASEPYFWCWEKLMWKRRFTENDGDNTIGQRDDRPSEARGQKRTSDEELDGQGQPKLIRLSCD